MKRLIFGIGIATILATGISTQGLAMSVTGNCSHQDNGLGFCEKTVSLVGNQLTIELKNTSPAINTGFVTADAFNLNAGTTLSNFTTSNANFSLLSTTAGSINVQPFGSRQFLISLSNQWQGGGNPNGGVGVGQTVTWGLTLGGDVSGITPGSVLASQTIRFKGFDDGGSDKTLITPGNPVATPEPGTILLMGSGLAGLGLWRWKTRKTE